MQGLFDSCTRIIKAPQFQQVAQAPILCLRNCIHAVVKMKELETLAKLQPKHFWRLVAQTRKGPPVNTIYLSLADISISFNQLRHAILVNIIQIKIIQCSFSVLPFAALSNNIITLFKSLIANPIFDLHNISVLIHFLPSGYGSL